MARDARKSSGRTRHGVYGRRRSSGAQPARTAGRGRRSLLVAKMDSKEVRYDEEPETTFGLRFMFNLTRILPVENQL